MRKLIREIKYVLECINGFVYGLKMPFSRCHNCGEWGSSTWYTIDNKLYCSCIESKRVQNEKS